MDHASTTEWLLSVNHQGKNLAIPLGTQATCLGRGTSADVRLKSSGVSRRHAEVSMDEDGCPQVTDLQSHNGTVVNRDKLTGTRKLKAGDKIRIAQWKFVVEQRTPSPSNGKTNAKPNGEKHILVLGGHDSDILTIDSDGTNSKSVSFHAAYGAGSDSDIIRMDGLGTAATPTGEVHATPPPKQPEQQPADQPEIQLEVQAQELPEAQTETLPEPPSAPPARPSSLDDLISLDAPDDAPASAPKPAPPAVAQIAEPTLQAPAPSDQKTIQPAPATLAAARKMMEAAQRRKEAQAGMPAAATPPVAMPTPAPEPAKAPAPAPAISALPQADKPRQVIKVIQPAAATLAAARKLMEAAERNKAAGLAAPIRVIAPAEAEATATPGAKQPTATVTEADLPAARAKARDISPVDSHSAPEVSAAHLAAVQAFAQSQSQTPDAAARRRQLCDFAVSGLFPAGLAAILNPQADAHILDHEASSLPDALLHVDANLLAAAQERQAAMVAWDTCLDNGTPAVALCCPLSDGTYLYSATVLANAKNNWLILLAQAAFMERLIGQCRSAQAE